MDHGEAREADIGIAGGVGEGLLFKKGEIIRKIKQENMVLKGQYKERWRKLKKIKEQFIV